MKVETKSVFGNFDIQVEAEIDNKALKEVVAPAGLLQIVQRSPASKAEKLLGYPDAKKRPDKFERNSIPFNQENADALAKALSGEVEIAEGVKIVLTTIVSEHVASATAENKGKRDCEAALGFHQGGLMDAKQFHAALDMIAKKGNETAKTVLEYRSKVKLPLVEGEDNPDSNIETPKE